MELHYSSEDTSFLQYRKVIGQVMEVKLPPVEEYELAPVEDCKLVPMED